MRNLNKIETDKIARWLVVVCVVVLIPVGITANQHPIDSYIFGILTGFLATLAGFWERMML